MKYHHGQKINRLPTLDKLLLALLVLNFLVLTYDYIQFHDFINFFFKGLLLNIFG